jgi:alkanesulfonate monooxygenase SsuD/methylene tetrahydromethanopterin reductase-like flavin-dependent oxidoreductase (luciferase family)
LTDAVAEPKPVQKRLPLLIGGGGEQKTLRTVAKYADYWHGHGTPDVIRHKLEVLTAHCAEVGRDIREITPLTSVRPDVVLRDRVADVEAQLDRVKARFKLPERPEMNPIHTVDALVERCAALWQAGARGFILYFMAPFDHETIERVATEVRPKLEAAIA